MNNYTHCAGDALEHVTFPEAAETRHVAFTVGWPS